MELQFVPTNSQLADIFTKPLTEERLFLLRDKLGIALVKEWLMSKCLPYFTQHPKDMFSNNNACVICDNHFEKVGWCWDPILKLMFEMKIKGCALTISICWKVLFLFFFLLVWFYLDFCWTSLWEIIVLSILLLFYLFSYTNPISKLLILWSTIF